MTTYPARYGFVGTGAITRAMVEGLSTVEQPPLIVVSPRGAAVAAELAGRFANVSVAADNQAVVDAAPTIVLATRPPVTAEVLAGLDFAADQVLVSAVAGFTVDALRAAVAPATEVARSIPLPSTAVRQGLVPVFPPQPEALDFFRRLGDVVEVEHEASFDAFSASSAYAAFQLDLLGTIEAWLVGRGVAAVDARRYVAVLLTGLADAVNSDDHPFGALGDEHATPGGLNEQIRTYLRGQGVHELMGTALDDVMVRISG